MYLKPPRLASNHRQECDTTVLEFIEYTFPSTNISDCHMNDIVFTGVLTIHLSVVYSPTPGRLYSTDKGEY